MEEKKKYLNVLCICLLISWQDKSNLVVKRVPPTLVVDFKLFQWILVNIRLLYTRTFIYDRTDLIELSIVMFRWTHHSSSLNTDFMGSHCLFLNKRFDLSVFALLLWPHNLRRVILNLQCRSLYYCNTQGKNSVHTHIRTCPKTQDQYKGYSSCLRSEL